VKPAVQRPSSNRGAPAVLLLTLAYALNSFSDCTDRERTARKLERFTDRIDQIQYRLEACEGPGGALWTAPIWVEGWAP
jgi:hypothetical protein